MFSSVVSDGGAELARAPHRLRTLSSCGFAVPKPGEYTALCAAGAFTFEEQLWAAESQLEPHFE